MRSAAPEEAWSRRSCASRENLFHAVPEQILPVRLQPQRENPIETRHGDQLHQAVVHHKRGVAGVIRQRDLGPGTRDSRRRQQGQPAYRKDYRFERSGTHPSIHSGSRRGECSAGRDATHPPAEPSRQAAPHAGGPNRPDGTRSLGRTRSAPHWPATTSMSATCRRIAAAANRRGCGQGTPSPCPARRSPAGRPAATAGRNHGRSPSGNPGSAANRPENATRGCRRPHGGSNRTTAQAQSSRPPKWSSIRRSAAPYRTGSGKFNSSVPAPFQAAIRASRNAGGTRAPRQTVFVPGCR